MFGASTTVVSVTALKSGSACLVGSCHLLVKHHSNTHFILCFYTTEMPCCAHLWSNTAPVPAPNVSVLIFKKEHLINDVFTSPC